MFRHLLCRLQTILYISIELNKSTTVILPTEIQKLYSSQHIIKMMKSRTGRGAKHETHEVELRNTYRSLIEVVEGNKLLGRYTRGWTDDIKWMLRTNYEAGEWSHPAQYNV